MAITTEAQLLSVWQSAQEVTYLKTAANTAVATIWCSLFNLAGNPPAGTIAGTSTTAGVVPDDSTTGTPAINAFGAGNTGYVCNVEFGCTVMARWRLYDLLFKAGAYAYNSSGVTLSSQPSYSGRIPGGDYAGTQIWVETVTAFTGVPAVTVTYTNQDGTTGQTTGAASAPSALKIYSMFQLPLAAGDTGVQKIESVTCATATAGTFNILVLRRLLSGRVISNDDTVIKGPDLTCMPIVFDNSAIYMMVAPDSTSTGIIEAQISIGNG